MMPIFTTVTAAIVLAVLFVPQAAAYSAGLSICDVTETRMVSGMGGANTPSLSIALNITRTNASSATVSITSTNSTVASTGIRGLLMWATDATGARVGTWSVREGQQLFAPVSLCSGGAISHSGAGVKSFDAASPTAPQGFNVTVSQSNVALPISVRAVVVFTRRVWMFVGPTTVEGLTGPSPSNSTNTTSSAPPMGLRGTGSTGATCGSGQATVIAMVAALVSLFLAL